MSKIHLGQGDARARHGSALPSAPGWCQPCYEQGAFVLATTELGDRCILHVDNGEDADPDRFGLTPPPIRVAGKRPPTVPRGRAARPTPPPGSLRGGQHPPRRAHTSRGAARALAYGRERARRRVDAGGWLPHPAWRSFIDTGWRVLVDQAEALARVEDLVDQEDWRADKRASWSQVLRQLVCAMDWSTGLVTGVAADRLGQAGARAPRTVSRVLAWARDVGLIVVVEAGASAAFLGSKHNRTPTYALVTNSPATQARARDTLTTEAPGSEVVDETGDLPESLVGTKPLTGGRRNAHASQPTVDWPSHRIPQTPCERNAAAHSLLRRMGLDGPSWSGHAIWRARALLKPWWDAGTCVAGLLHAAARHPDDQARDRGPITAGTNDPLRVLGYRLRPWQGRLQELPGSVVGHRGDYLARQAARITAGVVARQDCAAPPRPLPSAERAAAKAAVAAHLRQLRDRRRTDPEGQGPEA